MNVLPLFVRLADRPVILIGDGDAAAAKRRLLERAGAVIVGEDAPASLAIVAVEDDDDAEAVTQRLRARGILVNAVDRPALCDFTLPAIIDRSPVLIAIGTGGASAGLAKALRQRLETLLPESLGALATALYSARSAIRARWSDPAARRQAIDDALSAAGPLDPLEDFKSDAINSWLSTEAATASSRLVTFTLTSDDPDDLTLAQARALSRADLVVHDARIAPAILHRVRADAARIAACQPPNPCPPGLTVILQRKSTT
jgi:uroporphyrin-III C-methyltransferase/precorrin-2 dehydrogenase/sirohydrochlorin ferrochelatase